MAEAETSSQPIRPDAMPVVDADRCVHGLSPIAQCVACVSACPRSAFALEDEGLTFDADVCDGCALCAAVCPEQAIDFGRAVAPWRAQHKEADKAFLACEMNAVDGEAGCVACLHALSLADLARLHRDGISAIVAASVDCTECPRGVAAETIDDRVAALARLTSDRGLPGLRLRRVSLDHWRAERDEAAHMNRRALLRAAFSPPVATKMRSNQAAEGPSTAALLPISAPDSILAEADRATLAVVTPQIDAAICHACGACVGICPHGAINLCKGSAPRYEIDATRCTGCGLCVDSCEPSAIALTRWGSAHPPAIALVHSRCRRCASPFYAVKDAAASEPGVCRICAGRVHQQKLFQVLP